MRHKIFKITSLTLIDTISFNNSKKTLLKYMEEGNVDPKTKMFVEGALFPTNYIVTKIKLVVKNRDIKTGKIEYDVSFYGKELSSDEMDKLQKKVYNG